MLSATALLLGCGSHRSGAGHETPFRWSDDFAAWSPNSRLILFWSDRPRHKRWDLYVMDVDGGHLQRLTDDKLKRARGHPVFVSNRLIAFTANGGRYVISVDGRGKKVRLRRHARHARVRRVGVLRRRGASPNVRWVTFGRHRLSGPRDWYGDTAVDVYLMRSDGSVLRRVATVGPATTFSPAWAPDSRAFAFDAPPNGGPSVMRQGTTISEVYVVPVSTAKAVQVSHDPGSCCASWSPDGKEIAFYSSDPGGYTGLTLVRPDGSHPRTHGNLDMSAIAWVLGGRKLLLTSGTGEYLVNSDGSHFARLLAQPNDYPVISPDGTKAVIVESGGPMVDVGCCMEYPRYTRIDVVDLKSGQLRQLTQPQSR
jgi:Tol biopolymer transport system component